MLTLQSGSACDVCAEEYGPQCQPHSIPCGHVLCSSCCSTIVQKTPSRLTPACPFCREGFAANQVRLIRLEYNTSGWSTPRRIPTLQSTQPDFSAMWARKTERLVNSEGRTSTRWEVRRLEEKVAKIAAKKCSVEEISNLHKELEDWLMADGKDDHEQVSLHLSAALLRAILMNHLAHSEASRNSKSLENSLRNKIDELESELKKLRASYSQKSQDYQAAWTELNKLRAQAGLPTIDTRATATSPPPPPTSPQPYSPTSATQTPISRFTSSHSSHSSHSRSASMSSRPSTPATTPISPSRSHTPAPSSSSSSHLRTQTPTPMSRTQTPTPSSHARPFSPSVRSHTPAPPPTLRYATPTPSTLRTTTPAPPPPVPHKPRRLSTPTPPKMMSRSTSEEKAELHERWLPSAESISQSPPTTHRLGSILRPASRMAYGSHAAVRS